MAITAGNVAILWAGDASSPPPPPESTRFHRVFEELAALGVPAEPVVYADAAADRVRSALLRFDVVLVWVNPIIEPGIDRSLLDSVLRDVASGGVFVSAHPDTIARMGTKEVLVATRHLAWGSDTYLYRTPAQLRAGLELRLPAGPRVLKQERGNGGDGVWRVEALDGQGDRLRVRVQHALRGARSEDMAFATMLQRFEGYFAGDASIVDQPYQERLADGMVRCYLVSDRVAGFGHQLVTALLPAPPGQPVPAPQPRLYYGPDKPEFQPLKRKLESGWIAAMQDALGIATERLPVIWDADFLLGPKTEDGEDTFVLCEINVSSVFPIPDEAMKPLAVEAARRLPSGRSRGPA